MIELPEDLQAFAEERVSAGQNTSVIEVVREALEEKKLATLRADLDAGMAELNAGLGVESSLEEFIAELAADAGLTL